MNAITTQRLETLYPCQHDIICQQDTNILVANSYRHPYLGHKNYVDMPGFLAKSLTKTIVCGNDSRIFPHNLWLVWHTCSAKTDEFGLNMEEKQLFHVLANVWKTDVLSKYMSQNTQHVLSDRLEGDPWVWQKYTIRFERVLRQP